MLLIINKLSAQNIDEVINFGDSLYSEHNFSIALNEYQRAFFFSENEKKQVLSSKIADCYIGLEKFGPAKAYCDSAIYYSATDSIKTECKLQKILCSILEKNYGYAILKLDELKTDSINYLGLKKNFFRGISYLGLEKYDEAFQTFKKAVASTDSFRITALQQLFDNQTRVTRPSPALATIMSVAIPGSGQIYTGNYFSGLNSIFLLAGLTCVGVNIPVLYPFILPVFSRYYTGGILHANHFAKEKRKINQYYFVNDILAIFPGNDKLSALFEVKQMEMNFHNHVLDSDAEIHLLLSASFLGYKKLFSSQDVDACVFTPTCSVYMMETIRKNGIIIGFFDGLDRLQRCHLLANEHNYEYNNLTQKYNDAP